MVIVCKYYTVELEFLNRAVLPKWKGNIIRGALGNALKKISCLTGRNNCYACNLYINCAYGYLYRAKTKGLVLSKIKHFTKPYVIKPPLEGKEFFEKGDTIKFSIVLFGDAIRFENDLLRALNAMCSNGLGMKNNRAKLRIKRIFVENPFRNERAIIYENQELYESKLCIYERDLKVKMPELFEIKFLTPFRLLKQNSLIAEPSFGDLFKFMLRKYSSIFYQYLHKLPNIDLDKLLKKAEKIETFSANLKKFQFVYKNETEIFISGEMKFLGKLNVDAKKVLSFCQLSHVGKRASYGHGWYIIK